MSHLSPTRRIGRRAQLRWRTVLPFVAAVAAASCSSDGGISVSTTCRVSSVTITPGTASVAAGASTTLNASIAASNCSPLPAVAWSSGATHIATVAAGVVTGVATGTSTITASAGGQSGTAQVTVHVPVNSIALTVPVNTVSIGASLQVTAQLRDAGGNILSGRQITWLSNNTGVATVSDAGQIMGVTVGNATITASVEGKSATVEISVIGLPTLTIVSRTPTGAATGVSIESTIQVRFSALLNAATVTATTFRVTQNGVPVAGTRLVNGDLVTFTPTPLLTEFTTTYIVTITTGLQSTVGNHLAAESVAPFTTVFADPLYFYRLTNEFQGPTKSLDTFGGTFNCFMGDSGNTTGQFWYFAPIQGLAGAFALRNFFQGDAMALEGGDGTARCLLTGLAPGGNFFTGQVWMPVAFGGALPTAYRLQNQNIGAAQSLDIADIGGELVPIFRPTANVTGQAWYFTRLSRR